MRLLNLKLQAFGPYADEVSVDFRVLRVTRLFLIHGPVGSGKTFLLDGICFALYGRSSGGERDWSGLRNLTAAPAQETISALDFEVEGQNFRVERHLGLGAEGELLETDVKLMRLPEFGNPSKRDILSATSAGVASMVERLLGLNAEQFCQVAILPQGRFRRFLLAEGAERRDILSNIFKSSRHLRFQEELIERSRVRTEELHQAWKEREQLISCYSQNGGGPRESLLRSQEELKSVDHDCQAHQDKSLEWEKSLEEAVRFEILDRQRLMSERELDSLKNDEGDPEEVLTEKLRAAVPRYEAWKKLTEQSEVISAELHEQRTQYENLKSNTDFLEAEVDRARKLEEEKFSLLRSIERLDELMEDLDGAAVLEEETLTAQARLDELAHSRRELALEVKAQKARAQVLEAELKKIALAEKKLGSLKQDIRDLSDLRGRVKQNELLEEAYEQASAREERFLNRIAQLEKEQAKLEKSLTKQRERDLADALHLLKKELKKDEECPLCGSVDHPNPYSSRKRRRNQTELDEAGLEKMKNKLEIARRELAQASERRARLEGRMEERELPPEVPPEVDEKTLAHLDKTVAAVEGVVSKKDDYRKELRQIQTHSKPARIKLKKMRLLRERLSATVEGIQRQHEERKKLVLKSAIEVLPQAQGIEMSHLPGLVAQERRSLEDRLIDLEKVEYTTERAELMAETFALQLAETRASEKRRDDLQNEATLIRLELEEEFRKEFSHWEDLSFSLARASRELSMQSGQNAVLDRETLIRTVERQLNQSQELLTSLPQPEMRAEQIRQALSREREQLEYKVSRRAALRKEIERSSEDVQKYDHLVEGIRGLEERTKGLNQLANLAAGQNSANFHEWYLNCLFARVLEAANLRLEVLAPNRFCLALKDGLEVRVVDFTASKVRSATTLSGGESFLASLALALGLGDVLQGDREARKRLQTLFIDEGFGYLDRRALEASLDCLESLKQEGRTVGVISHVPALRERIRAQVVVASNDGPIPYGVERIQVYAE